MTQGDFTGDKFLKVLEMAAPVASGVFGGWDGIFQEITQPEAAEVVLQSRVWRYGRGLSKYLF
jgi:predicted oxidoreductase